MGTPSGYRLRFRPTTNLVTNMDRISESLLASWQKLEVFRSHLPPSLFHQLASARILKKSVGALDVECRKFLALITGIPITAVEAFYYADRGIGGLGTFRLVNDANVCTLARATQLLSSSDVTVRSIFQKQTKVLILRGFNNSPQEASPSAFLSGATEGETYRLRYAAKSSTNLWTSARRAA